MFRTANQGPRHADNRFDAAMTAWRESSKSWYDGSVASVDQRLRRCAKLLGVANGAVGQRSIGESPEYLAALRELSADRQVLASLRDDLLTGGSGREVGVSPPGRTAAAERRVREAFNRSSLTPQERRWVDLESARFLNANVEVVAQAPEELAERARYHGEAHTSALGKRSKLVTAAFVDRVSALGQSMPRPRTAAAEPKTVSDFDAQLMFL